MSNAKIFVHWAKALGKSDRAVKGNYNAMNPESKEDKYRYNAGDFIAQVKKDYENLWCNFLIFSIAPVCPCFRVTTFYF